MVEPENLLEECYKHLRHSELLRDRYVQIYVSIITVFAGAQLFSDNPSLPIQILFGLFLTFYSLLSIPVMNKFGRVVRGYSNSILDIIEGKPCNIRTYLRAPNEVKRVEIPRISDSYTHFFIGGTVLWVIFTLIILFQLVPACT